MTVVVSVEGFSLGQGFYVEPTAYTISEINHLLAEDGYGPYTEDTLTAAMATIAMFIDKDLDYDYTGSPESSFYLSAIADIDTFAVSVPRCIENHTLFDGGPTSVNHTGNDDEWLGEFDYSDMSGWMISVNHNLIDHGSGQWVLSRKAADGVGENYGNTYVVRWQFTLWGYGADLGMPIDWGQDPYFEAANKDELYMAYAMSNDAGAKDDALAVMEQLDAKQSSVDAALSQLNEGSAPETGSRIPQSVSSVINNTMEEMAQTVTAPVFGTNAGEWTVLSLARGGCYNLNHKYFADYYDRIVDTVNETASSLNLGGKLHKVKSTENSRLIVALSSIGKDSKTVGDWDLTTPYDDFTWIKKQGINGPIWALIALDSNDYETVDETIRQQCVDFILSKQLQDGGWALSGTKSDPDITSMALQSLYPYRRQVAVAAAAETAFDCLSEIQNADGGYTSFGDANSESCAQVIVAACTWGIDPDTDSRFVKNGSSVVDALLAHYLEDAAGFEHIMGGGFNNMATDQACYALIAYDRFQNGKNSLYDMSDVKFDAEDETEEDEDADQEADETDKEEEKEEDKDSSNVITTKIEAALGLPAQINPGDTFNGVLSVTNWGNDDKFKLVDFIITVPTGVEVTAVKAGSRLSGGEVIWNLEAQTGKLRVVYFDANKYDDLTISGEQFPAELFTVSFKASQTAAEKLNIALSGMSVKTAAGANGDGAMVVVDTAKANGTVTVVKGTAYSAVCLYQGDDVDLIPAGKKAIAVAVTGIEKGVKLTFKSGENTVDFRYSSQITEKTGVASYIALVDSAMDINLFVVADNYTVGKTSATELTFGDSNTDGVVNAQDALAAVNAWVRKSQEPTDEQILAMNVNGDSRINTFDALGIVEAYVNNSTYAVVTAASTLATKQ